MILAVVIFALVVIAAGAWTYESVFSLSASCGAYPIRLTYETMSVTGTYSGTINTTWQNCSSYDIKFVVLVIGVSNTGGPVSAPSGTPTIIPGQTILVQNDYNPSISFFSGSQFQVHAVNASAMDQSLSRTYTFTV